MLAIPKDVRLSILLLSVSFLGGMIFGINTGVIAGALPAMEEEFPWLATSPTDQGILTCSILLGALVGALLGTYAASACGKRAMLAITGLVSIVGAVGSALSPWLGLIIFFREVLGVGVGFASVICPVYVAENAPLKYRGSLGASFQMSITLGIFLSYMINLAFTNVAYGFRWMLACGAIPAVLLAPLPLILPKTTIHIDTEEGEEVEVLEAGSSSGMKVYINLVKVHYKTTLLALVLAITLQLTGINAVLYYTPTIFENAGFSPTASLWATNAVGFWNFLTTFFAFFLVDKLGRRPLILVGLSIIVLSLVLLGFTFQFLTGTASLVCSMLLILLYIAGFEGGVGCLFWPLLTEIFPVESQEAGATLMNAVQWLLNIGLSAVFPSLVSLLSQAVTFWIFAVVGVGCLVFLFFRLPETKKTGHTVEVVNYTNEDGEEIFE